MTDSSKIADAAIEHVDVLIIGAGISGLGAACHIQNECNNKSYLILEGRDAIGGTWDLFKYPGIRSDSDLYTFGYDFKPWHGHWHPTFVSISGSPPPTGRAMMRAGRCQQQLTA